MMSLVLVDASCRYSYGYLFQLGESRPCSLGSHRPAQLSVSHLMRKQLSYHSLFALSIFNVPLLRVTIFKSALTVVAAWL